MEYVTTRDPREHYTAQQALTQDRGADGGLFLPLHFPRYGKQELNALAQLPFTARIAQVLNTLCDAELTQWDVDFCVNRNPIRLVELPQKILLTQCWHNQEGTLDFMVRALAGRMRRDGEPIATDWAQVAVRLAILTALFADDRLPGGRNVDVAAVCGDFLEPVSAWYGRQMGLPIGDIVICCNENAGLWELFYRGQLRTDSLSRETATPEGDGNLPSGLERLIFAVGGKQEVYRYLQAQFLGRTYYPEEAVLPALVQGFAVSVVGKHRMEGAVRSVYACGTLLGPYDGLCHAGLLDYRAKAGHNSLALILSTRCPELDGAALTAVFDT